MPEVIRISIANPSDGRYKLKVDPAKREITVVDAVKFAKARPYP